MSGRMLRRALRDKQPADLVEIPSDEEVAEERTGARNIFSFLQEDSVNDDEEDDDEQMPSSSAKPIQAAAPSKWKKKKGSKNKKKETMLVKEDVEDLSKLMEGPALEVSPTVASVICVDPKHLRAEEELRRIFGSRLINSVEKRARKRNTNPLLRGRKYLVQPMNYWPRWDGGVSMELRNTKDGIMHFRYVYSSAYMETQKEYDACVSSHDPNTIASLLAVHPYHIDSLLALAEVYKHIGEHQQSSAVLERCLYALECAWHPLFNPLGGKCRLDYSCKENKPLFLALFRHMQHLGRRGCHRTALEVCKMLLSLDLDDPTGAKFCVDYYALRSEQYQWLESFVDIFYDDKSVALLPNFSFSLAVARFHLEKQEAADPNSEAVPSSDLLQQALMLHPSLLKKITAKAPIKEDAAWTAVLKHPLFAKSTAGGPSLEHLINIYIERSYLIWRIPELQTWLKAAATEVVNKRDGGGEAASWSCARSEAFQANHNEYQHLSLTEFSDATPTLPPDEQQIHGRIQDNHGEEEAAAAGDPAAGLENRNFISVFLESLFPWNNYGGVDLAEEEAEAEEL